MLLITYDIVYSDSHNENLSGVNKEVAHRGKNGERRESILKILAEKQKQADRRNQANYSRYRSVNRGEKDL